MRKYYNPVHKNEGMVSKSVFQPLSNFSIKALKGWLANVGLVMKRLAMINTLAYSKHLWLTILKSLKV